jgi:hypothetical protein
MHAFVMTLLAPFLVDFSLLAPTATENVLPQQLKFQPSTYIFFGKLGSLSDKNKITSTDSF